MLVAASDGAPPAAIDSALAIVPDSSLGVGDAILLLALAERAHRDTGPYEAAIRRLGGEYAEPMLRFTTTLRTTHDPAAAERVLGRVTPGSRGLAWIVGTVMLGDAAPPAWREGGRRLMFASERPYFR